MDMAAGLEQLLEAALSIERECNEVRGVLRDRFEGRTKREGEKFVSLEARLDRIEMKVDNALARVTADEDRIEQFRDDQEKGMDACRATLNQVDVKLCTTEESYERLQALVELKNGAQVALQTPPFKIVMDSYEERKANDEQWCSPPFYSSAHGYKMCLQVYPNGLQEGKDTHVSLFVAVLPGEFDDILPWPFCGRVTVHLINHRRGANLSHTVNFTSADSLARRQRSFAKDVIDPGQANSWGTRTFASHQVLLPDGFMSDREFLKKDSLTFRIWNVDVFNCHH